jgi:hypothetical protein
MDGTMKEVSSACGHLLSEVGVPSYPSTPCVLSDEASTTDITVLFEYDKPSNKMESQLSSMGPKVSLGFVDSSNQLQHTQPTSSTSIR